MEHHFHSERNILLLLHSNNMKEPEITQEIPDVTDYMPILIGVKGNTEVTIKAQDAVSSALNRAGIENVSKRMDSSNGYGVFEIVTAKNIDKEFFDEIVENEIGDIFHWREFNTKQ